MCSFRPYGVALALSLMGILLTSTGLSAQTNGKKVALVLGNSAYTKIQALRNPANDASDMAAALARMGFTVLSKTDLDRRAMRGLIDDFNKAIQGAEVALFFYSGHGVQMDGENYLVPVNAEVAVPGDVPDECVSLSRITARMSEAGAGTNIIILDACRDNPFKAVSRGIERGLAVVGQKPPESIIVYATAENEKADDGNGRNGVFTAALLKNIKRPDSFADVLLDVKAQVRRDTSEKQKPATYENLSHHVYLAGGGQGSNQTVAPTTAMPTLTVTRSYGALTIRATTAGTLYLDGTAMGELPAGAEAKLDNIEVGDRSLELRHTDGETESRTASVLKEQSTSVSFTWKKASAVPSPATPSPVAKIYRIGDTGPAGGIVFYDKGSYSDGWRYLEAAPSDQKGGIQWYNGRGVDIKTGTAVGTGKANTEAIITAQGSGNYAATLCKNLSIGGFSDWFLPSTDELGLMYKNLKKAGLGGFGGSWHWSSSQGSGGEGVAWGQTFSTGNQSSIVKGKGCIVRAVRAF
jgi:hypothetical protein